MAGCRFAAEHVMKPSRIAAFLMLGAAPLLAMGANLRAATPSPRTHTYKQVDGLGIKADVFSPVDVNGPIPAIVFIHGGSLINGSRTSVARWRLLQPLLDAGVAVVSIDYRLAPETKLPAIVADVEDAIRWVRKGGAVQPAIDPRRIGICGVSAGGYLALTMGYRIEPAVRVIVAEMGYGDLVGAWQQQPSRHRPHYDDSNLTAEEAWRQVAGRAVSNGSDRQGDGSAFNDFIRRTAQWPKAISGWDPRRDAEKFAPYLPLRNVTSSYPPTFLLHGRSDTDVPFEQAELMAAELARHRVEHRLVGLRNTEHGHRGADPAELQAAYDAALAFIVQRLSPK
jgi:acetyl esterase/lipase